MKAQAPIRSETASTPRLDAVADPSAAVTFDTLRETMIAAANDTAAQASAPVAQHEAVWAVVGDKESRQSLLADLLAPVPASKPEATTWSAPALPMLSAQPQVFAF